MSSSKGGPGGIKNKQSSEQGLAAAAQPQKQKINERKIPKRYQLTILKDGQYEPLNDEEWSKFCIENPELAKYF
jgi:hypothetical protein